MWLSTKLMKKKDFFFFSFHCEQYHNIMIHTQKTPSVMCETLIIFPLFGAVNSKQHTINTICKLYVRTGLLLSHETCFHSSMNDSKEISAIT